MLAGRYRVVRQLGQGGMGSVWLAEDLDFNKCEEIQRARAYLGYADEVFEMTGVTKYSAKIEETLAGCRKLVDKATLGERVAGFVKRARERICAPSLER